MKNLLKPIGYLLIITGLILTACNEGSRSIQSGKRPMRDTVFVEVGALKKPLIPKDYVNDYIRLFTPSQTATLDSLIINYEKETTNQVAIITIDTQWIKIDSFDSFVKRVHNAWGIGQKEKNNGILIGICPGYRKVRINNGYGIEKVLSNEETKKIIDNFIFPAYREGNYFEGTRDALLEIMRKVRTIK